MLTLVQAHKALIKVICSLNHLDNRPLYLLFWTSSEQENNSDILDLQAKRQPLKINVFSK